MKNSFRISGSLLTAASFLLIPVAQALVPATLIARWGFDEAGGVAAIDATGRSLDATMTNATRSMDVPSGEMSNRSSLSLNGSAYVSAGHVALKNRSFTIAAWLRTDEIGGTQTILSQKGMDQTGKTLALRLNGSGGLQFSFLRDDLTTADNVFRPNTWHHVSFTFNSKTKQRRIYVDGDMKATGTASGVYLGASGPTVLGRMDTLPQGSDYWRGLMDEVRIYDQVLPDSDIALLAQKVTRSSSSSSQRSIRSVRSTTLTDRVNSRRVARQRFGRVAAPASTAPSTIKRTQWIPPAIHEEASTSSSSQAHVIATPAPATFPSGASIYRVTSFQLHVRKDSRATSLNIRTLHEGDTLAVTEMLKNGWARVVLADGTTGFVHAGFIRMIP